MVICNYRNPEIPATMETDAIVINELNIGKCRGCLRCRIVKSCITYNDDAPLQLPAITSAERLDIYLQKDSDVALLLNRILYGLAKQGQGRPYALDVEDAREVDYVKRMLDWCGYKLVE